MRSLRHYIASYLLFPLSLRHNVVNLQRSKIQRIDSICWKFWDREHDGIYVTYCASADLTNSHVCIQVWEKR